MYEENILPDLSLHFNVFHILCIAIARSYFKNMACSTSCLAYTKQVGHLTSSRSLTNEKTDTPQFDR
jgi:hypothetical protein